MPLVRRLFPYHLELDIGNNMKEALYEETLRQLQEERSPIGRQSTVDLSRCSDASYFLTLILRSGISLEILEAMAPNTMKEALQRNPETLTHATGVWKDMTDRFFRDLGRPVPGWPGFVEIQEELGIEGKSAVHCAARRIKRRAQMVWRRMIDELSVKFPKSRSLKRKRCYLSAALTTDDVMPEGWISCKKVVSE